MALEGLKLVPDEALKRREVLSKHIAGSTQTLIPVRRVFNHRSFKISESQVCMLIDDSGSTPVSLSVAEERLVGRITGGTIANLTAAQVITLLGGVNRWLIFNAFEYPAPGTDWTPSVYGASLAQNLAAKTCWLPLPGLKVGDIIVQYKLHGQATEAAALTLDCRLAQLNLGSITYITNGSMAQVTSGGGFTRTVNCDDTTVSSADKFYLELTGTTGAGDSIYVEGAEVQVTRLV